MITFNKKGVVSVVGWIVILVLGTILFGAIKGCEINFPDFDFPEIPTLTITETVTAEQQQAETQLDEEVLDEEVDQEEECTFSDSDGGYKINEKGTCDDKKAILNNDYCVGNTLYEYYLGSGDACFDGCKVKSWSCTYGCSGGECLPDPNLDCSNFCTGMSRTSPYTGGNCIFLHGNEPETACSNGGDTYENPLTNKCLDDNWACCCEGGMVIN